MAKTKLAKIVLVRTGLTEWDEQGRLAGEADLPLAEAAAGALAGLKGEVSGRSRRFSADPTKPVSAPPRHWQASAGAR